MVAPFPIILLSPHHSSAKDYLLEVKLPYDPLCPSVRVGLSVRRSVGRSVGWSVGRSVGRSVYLCSMYFETTLLESQWTVFFQN